LDYKDVEVKESGEEVAVNHPAPSKFGIEGELEDYYKLKDLIEEGHYGVVNHCKQKSSNKQFACKRSDYDLSVEAEAAKLVEHHNVVKIEQYFMCLDGSTALVMEKLGRPYFAVLIPEKTRWYTARVRRKAHHSQAGRSGRPCTQQLITHGDLHGILA
jgi:serine/threonine protein kinase